MTMNPNGPALRGAVDLSGLGAKPRTTAQSAPQGAHPGIVEGTDANFAAIVELSKTVPVVVDLWATWCGPCVQLSPILEKLVIEADGRLVLAKVDVDANPGLAGAFGAQSIPTVVGLVGGQPVELFTGAIPEAQVREVFAQLLALAAQHGVTGSIPVDGETPAEVEDPVNPHFQAAFDAIEAADYPAAAAAYRAALAENPRDSDASAGLAQVNLLERLHGKTLDAIRNAAALNPTDVSAQLDVADLDLSGGHVEDAFARLLDLFKTASADDRQVIRARLLELFEVVGLTDPRVNAARTALASLLY
ncbi:MAG TPA: tetratricopeptide repeat protein [Microbacteriaceae bacterium]|nr:tetratricopeptide repeat protein [Microbacteriaceae bacterium]